MDLPFAEHLLTELNLALEQVSPGAPGELGPIQDCLALCCKHLSNLRCWAATTGFVSQEGEIAFFKHFLPAVESRLIYYSLLLGIEERQPARTPAASIAHYNEQYTRIDSFRHQHPEFVRYVRAGHTYLDAYFFQRVSGAVVHTAELGNVFYLADPQLSTPRSFQLATLLALDSLEVYLGDRIWQLESPGQHKLGTTPLVWEASISNLMELIYGLVEIRAFGGKVKDISRVVKYFEQAFGVRVANPYATHEDNRLRKKDNAPFLRSLLAGYLRRVDHDDEFAPRK